MNNLYTNIESLCNTVNITIGKMCSDLDISRGNITDLKKGRKKSLSSDTLNKIAQYFDVSIDMLINKSVDFDDFAFAMYNESKKLSDEDKQQLLDLAKFLADRK